MVITLQDRSQDERYVTVSDRGIGMTASVLTNYFLRAGASFRRSEAWRQQHESGAGGSRVLRSGRFGVGALAAFLIGDEIEVSTRHIGTATDSGLAFKATIDSDQIQLNRHVRPVGTTVKIRISDEKVWSRLMNARWDWNTVPMPEDASDLSHWDWYCLADPTVRRLIIRGGETQRLTQRWTVPEPESELPPAWHRLTVPGYKDIHWTQHSKLPLIICNGIIVERRHRYERGSPASEGLRLAPPTISIFDPDGLLPLNLQRTELALGQLPFADELLAAQCEDFVAWALVNTPTSLPRTPEGMRMSYPAASLDIPRLTFAFTTEGAVLIDRWILEQISFMKPVFTPVTAKLPLSPEPREILVPIDLERAGSDAQKAWFRCSVADWNFRDTFKPFEAFHATGRRTIIETSFYRDLKKPGIVARFLWDAIREEESNRVWTILSSGSCVSGRLNFRELLELPASSAVGGLTEFARDSGPKPGPSGPQQQENPSPLGAVWQRLCGEAVIPFDVKTRKMRFREAYRLLAPLIEYYELQKQNRVRSKPRAVPDAKEGRRRA